MINSNKNITKIIMLSAVLMVGVSTQAFAKNQLMESEMTITASEDSSGSEVITRNVMPEEEIVNVTETNPFTKISDNYVPIPEVKIVEHSVVQAEIIQPEPIKPTSPLPQQSIAVANTYPTEQIMYPDTPRNIAPVQTISYYDDVQNEQPNMSNFEQGVLEGYTQAATEQAELQNQGSIFTEILAQEDPIEPEQAKEENVSSSDESIVQTSDSTRDNARYDLR